MKVYPPLVIQYSGAVKRSAMKRSTKPMKRTTRINPVSKRRAKVNRVYWNVRQEQLAARPTCEARTDGCTGRATDIHHRLSRGRSGRDSDLTDPDNFLMVCRSCHEWIESHRDEALKRGWLWHWHDRHPDE